MGEREAAVWAAVSMMYQQLVEESHPMDPGTQPVQLFLSFGKCLASQYPGQMAGILKTLEEHPWVTAAKLLAPAHEMYQLMDQIAGDYSDHDVMTHVEITCVAPLFTVAY